MWCGAVIAEELVQLELELGLWTWCIAEDFAKVAHEAFHVPVCLGPFGCHLLVDKALLFGVVGELVSVEGRAVVDAEYESAVSEPGEGSEPRHVEPGDGDQVELSSEYEQGETEERAEDLETS